MPLNAVNTRVLMIFLGEGEQGSNPVCRSAEKTFRVIGKSF